MGKVILSSMKTDYVVENDGIWVDVAKVEGLRLKIRSSDNPEYTAALASAAIKLNEKYPKISECPPEEKSAVRGELLARFILTGWEGLDEDYTQECALSTLKDHGYRKFCDIIEDEAAKLSRLRVAYTDDVVKN